MFYDGTKLLSLQDINGDRPEIYISTSNRSAGKTTYFNRFVVNKYIKNKSLFGLIYRYNYELRDVAGKFFSDINSLFFPNYIMTAKVKGQGKYAELYLNDNLCGYALALNNADAIKKYSHFFNEIDRLLFDEFQSETGSYCPNEIEKFQSLHTSLARGHGKQVRYLPVYMISNPVTLLNPYYSSLGIGARLTRNVKFLRGNGWVLEQGFNNAASDAQKRSAFNRAFNDSSYQAYSASGIYLLDNKSFIEKPNGDNRYIATLLYKGKNYAVREYYGDGVLYCDDRADLSYPLRISVTSDDHTINYTLLSNGSALIRTLRSYFECGQFRFKDLNSKTALMTAISYY